MLVLNLTGPILFYGSRLPQLRTDQVKSEPCDSYDEKSDAV